MPEGFPFGHRSRRPRHLLVMNPDPKPGLLKSIEELSQVFTDSDSRSLLTNATKALLHGEYYKFLKVLRTLLPREERVLNSRMG